MGKAIVTVEIPGREPVVLVRRTKHAYRFAVVGYHKGEPYLISMHFKRRLAMRRRGAKLYSILPVTFTS